MNCVWLSLKNMLTLIDSNYINSPGYIFFGLFEYHTNCTVLCGAWLYYNKRQVLQYLSVQ